MPKGKPTEFGKLGAPSRPVDVGADNQGKPVSTKNPTGRKPPSGGTGTAKPEPGPTDVANNGKGT